MAIGDEIYEQEANKKLKNVINKNIVEKILEYIDTKNSHGKNELKMKILELVIKELK